jgi:hypothetical protein
MFIDTNIVSKVKKGILSISTRRANISSVTASELLLVYSGSRTAANYYVPVISPFHLAASIGSSKRDHPFPKRFTDRIVFSFGKDFEPLMEFGSNAIAKMVNEQNTDLLRQSIAFMEKKQQKVIREDFEFLMENEILCVPLTPAVVSNAYHLLSAYRAAGGHVKTVFRNSWNDILILSTAQDSGDRFLTGDSQLSRFAASLLGEFTEQGSSILEIRLNAVHDEIKKKNRESKGYINKGWRASFVNGRLQAL